MPSPILLPPVLLIDLEVSKHAKTIESIGAYYNEEHCFEGQSVHDLVQLWIKTSPKIYWRAQFYSTR